jgi:hypothetical protein
MKKSREGAKKIRTRRIHANGLVGQELTTFSWQFALLED